jgi:putative ABC transport system permease protein
METLRSDLRYALRTLAKNPGFALVAAIALALGIGASTAIFSVIDNVVMEPFPYLDPTRIMSVRIHDTERNELGGRGTYTGPEFLDYVEQNRVFDWVTGSSWQDILYRSGEGTERFGGILVTPGTFAFLGSTALLGRVIDPPDYEPGATPVFVLRHKTWVNRFSADPKLLGKSFILNGTPRTLIGIMPPRFALGDADVWLPEKPSNSAKVGWYGLPRYWAMFGHLKAGVSIREAEADLIVIANRLATVYPKEYPKHFSVQLRSLTDLVVGRFKTTLFIVLTAVALLLLICCANVANLLLAHAAAREKEFAIRAALGARRWRIVRQLLVESLLLALSGACIGTLLAWGGLEALVSLMPQYLVPAEAVIGLNASVLLFTLAVTVLTALIFGLAPALQVARHDLNDSLRYSATANDGGSRYGRLRNAVVVLEVALSLTLLVCAGLLMRSFVALRQVHLGLEPDHILVTRLPLPEDRYKTADHVAGFFRPLLLRLKALPGVVEAAETSTLPPYGGIPSDIEIRGKTHGEKWDALYQLCSEGYFLVLRIKLLEGRLFTEFDVNGARKLAVINETLQKKYFGNENPIGGTIFIRGLSEFPDPVRDPHFQIIGVVADVKNQGLQEPVKPEIWVPYTVTGSAARGILVRTTKEPLALMNDVRHEIWATDSNVALTLTGTLQGYINSFSYAGPRFGFLLMSIFGVIGLLLVTIGVYGVLAYTTARRTHEIGIRMALGADNADVLKLIIRKGVGLVAVGTVIGLIVSLSIAHVIATQLWGVSAYDPMTLASVVLLLLITGVVACWIPARRAARVDPLIALRHE